MSRPLSKSFKTGIITAVVSALYLLIALNFYGIIHRELPPGYKYVVYEPEGKDWSFYTPKQELGFKKTKTKIGARHLAWWDYHWEEARKERKTENEKPKWRIVDE